MKNLLLFLFIIPLIGSAQADFDYSFYTSRAFAVHEGKSDTITLSMFKKIEKSADELKLISPTDPTDCETFIISFLMWDRIDHFMVYLFFGPDRKKVAGYLFVKPGEHLLLIQQNTGNITRKYY